MRHPREKAPSTALSHEVASITSRGRGYRHRTLAGRIVPAVNGVGVVGHGAILTHSIRGRVGAIFPAMPRRTSKKDSPAKLAGRMKRRWRIVLMRKTGEVLGTVEAADSQAAEKVAAIEFELDEQQRRRLLVQELA